MSYPLEHLVNSSRSDRSNNRNDRNRNQNNRDRYRNNNNNNNNSNNSNRSQNNRGPVNQGPGILGAKPGDRTIPDLPANPLQVPALGIGGGGLGSGLTAQLAQQQQQLMAMVQTQSLLAAMQAQANANAQAQVQNKMKPNMPSPMGLLPTPLIPRNQSRDVMRQNRKRGRNDNWGGGGNYGNKRERFDNNRRQQQGGNRGNNQMQNRGRMNQQSQPAKKVFTLDKVQVKKEATQVTQKEREDVEEEAEAPQDNVKGDKEQEEANSTQEEDNQTVEEVKDIKPDIEFNDRPLPKAINFLGEDVDALMISLFDKKRAKYICQQCKIICNIPTSFHKHLLGRRHARTILEKQGKELDVEEFKNFSMGIVPAKNSVDVIIKSETKTEEKDKELPQLTSPSSTQSASDVEDSPEFVKYTCDTRKTAKKEGNIITISSVTESRVKIDGFTSGKNMLGCEFVKAVSGFNCRLCKSFIRSGGDVIQHIKGRKHQMKYKTYINEHPQYEELQLKRNKELEAVLEPKEGEEVLLFEVLDKDTKTTTSKPKSRRRESQSEEVPVTMFVIAPPPSDEGEQIDCEPGDLDVDMDGLDQEINEDSFLAEESTEELKGALSTTEDEDENLYDPAEITGVDELTAETQPTATTPGQLEETEDFLPLSLDESSKTEETEDVDESLLHSPRSSANQWKDQEEPDLLDTSLEDSLTAPIEPVITSTAKRGKKGTKGGGMTRGGAARGRGRGRGARRSARNAAGSGKGAKAKKGKANEETENSDVSFMDGFEVIDEIGDGED